MLAYKFQWATLSGVFAGTPPAGNADLEGAALTDSTGAGSDSKDDGSKRDAAHPAGESQGDGKPPGDDWIKKSQFVAALNNVTTKVDALTAENQELRAAQQKRDEPKQASLAELRKLVEAGELTQDQADGIWERQTEERITRKVAAQVGQSTDAQERARKVSSELQGFKELQPEVWDATSPEHAKVAREYQRLVDEGQPATQATELAALRIAFGDLSTLRASKSARSGPADTHSETGGGRPPVHESTKDVLKTLSPQQKEYYEAGIKAGRYPKGWADVKAELEYTPRKSA